MHSKINLPDISNKPFSKEKSLSKIKTAIIGVGSLGQHHARILASHPNSLLTAIVDTDNKRKDKFAKQYNVKGTQNYKDLLGIIDAVVLAVPTPLHYQIAKDFLLSGVHCFVEKPFTSIVQEAEELISIAINKNLILQVGHIERFNPAVVAAIPYINNPKFIEVNRLGPYDPRTSHIGVILDLMIHDLDILLSLVKDKIIGLEAFGAKVLSEYEDIVKVRIKFENGTIADLSASRVSIEKYRKIRIFQNDGYISVDYANKSLKIYKKKSPIIKSFNDIKIIKPNLGNKEQLFQELDHFLSCVIEGKKPLVSGEHGRDSLELALEILKNIKL